MIDKCSRICEKNLCLSGPQKHRVQSRRLSGRKYQIHRRRDISPSSSIYSYALDSSVHKNWEYKAAVTGRTTGLSSLGSVPMQSLSGSSCRRGSAYSLGSPSAVGMVPSPLHLLSSRAHRSLKSALVPRPCRLQDQDILSFLVTPPPAAASNLDMANPSVTPLSSGRRSSLRSTHASQFTSIGGTAQMLVMSSSIGSGGIGRDEVNPMPSAIHMGRNTERSHRAGAEEEGEGFHGPTPTLYTFRRRNAIVEGTEDAPRATDFQDASAS